MNWWSWQKHKPATRSFIAYQSPAGLQLLQLVWTHQAVEAPWLPPAPAPHNNWRDTPQRWYYTAPPEKPISCWIWARATCQNWSKQALLGQNNITNLQFHPSIALIWWRRGFLPCNLVSSLNNPLTDCCRRKAMIRKWYCLVPASVGFPERNGKYWIILRFLLADAHREKNRCGTESLHLCDIYFQRGSASIYR